MSRSETGGHRRVLGCWMFDYLFDRAQHQLRLFLHDPVVAVVGQNVLPQGQRGGHSGMLVLAMLRGSARGENHYRLVTKDRRFGDA